MLHTSRFCLLLIIAAWQLVLCHGALHGSENNSTADKNLPHELQIISYNVLYGFNHHKGKALGVKWLKEQEAEVIALQELNGIKESELKELAAAWGHPHVSLLKENGFPVGISSKEAIEVVEKRQKDMWHGYLHCKTQNCHFIVVHLSPFRYQFRLKEADIIGDKIKALLEQNENVMVLGDFNSLSSVDADTLHANKYLLDSFIKKEQEQEKIRNLNNGHYDFSVIQSFFDTGLIDPYTLATNEQQTLRHSFPSNIIAMKEEDRQQSLRRIDYILISKSLQQHVQQITTPHTAVLDQISDHYPVILQLKQR